MAPAVTAALRRRIGLLIELPQNWWFLDYSSRNQSGGTPPGDFGASLGSPSAALLERQWAAY
jgi:hypothetical protein